MIIVLQVNAYSGLWKRILVEDYCIVDATPCILVSEC